jgi:hypothetical protein
MGSGGQISAPPVADQFHFTARVCHDRNVVTHAKATAGIDLAVVQRTGCALSGSVCDRQFDDRAQVHSVPIQRGESSPVLSVLRHRLDVDLAPNLEPRCAQLVLAVLHRNRDSSHRRHASVHAVGSAAGRATEKLENICKVGKLGSDLNI